jgi:hypothetical protein
MKIGLGKVKFNINNHNLMIWLESIELITGDVNTKQTFCLSSLPEATMFLTYVTRRWLVRISAEASGSLQDFFASFIQLFQPNTIFQLVICFITVCNYYYFYDTMVICWPPLWSSGQSTWLQIQRSPVRFLALPDFLRSSGSGTGSTQPREYNWEATRKKK